MLFIVGIDEVNSKESGGSYNVLKVREMQKAGGRWSLTCTGFPSCPSE